MRSLHQPLPLFAKVQTLGKVCRSFGAELLLGREHSPSRPANSWVDSSWGLTESSLKVVELGVHFHLYDSEPWAEATQQTSRGAVAS